MDDKTKEEWREVHLLACRLTGRPGDASTAMLAIGMMFHGSLERGLRQVPSTKKLLQKLPKGMKDAIGIPEGQL